jgi:nucleoside-diphosphate-sugar epimerase
VQMYKNVLITGATGFLGLNLTHNLINSFDELNLYCHLRPSKTAPSYLNLSQRISFLSCELDDIVLPIHPGIVIHCAAIRNNDPDLWAVNVRSTEILAQKAVESGWDFIFCSSQAVYGDSDCFPTPESQTLNPLTEYAKSKIAAEEVIRNQFKFKKARYLNLRLARIYGKLVTSRYDGMLDAFFSATINHQIIEIQGNGDCLLDLLHVSDFCDAIGSIFKSNDWTSGTFNLGSDKHLTVSQFVQMLKEIYPSVKYRINPSAFERKGWFLNSKKFKDCFNWDTKTLIDQGMIEAIREYSNENHS